jgi:hypothetical protein
MSFPCQSRVATTGGPSPLRSKRSRVPVGRSTLECSSARPLESRCSAHRSLYPAKTLQASRCARMCAKLDADRVRKPKLTFAPREDSAWKLRNLGDLRQLIRGLAKQMLTPPRRSAPKSCRPGTRLEKLPKNLPTAIRASKWRPVSYCGVERRRPDSNRGWRFCRPLPYHLATAPGRRASLRGTQYSPKPGPRENPAGGPRRSFSRAPDGGSGRASPR